MIYFTHTSGIINYIHYRPFDSEYGLGKTQAELEQTGVLVESIPEPEIIEGKHAELKYDETTQELYYDYVDIIPPPSNNPEIEELRQQIQDLQTTIDTMLGD